MKASIFTSDEINQFEKSGYVHLKEAFPRNSALAMQDFMWTELKHLKGIDCADHSTWSKPWVDSTRQVSTAFIKPSTARA